MNTRTLILDGRPVSFSGEKNLLEVIRAAHIELPTFCYHSELSVYGACRLCMVEVEGRGLVAACSTPPEPGMKVRTQTGPIRELRRTNLELLLASGAHDCPTCAKSGACKLQDLAERLGVTQVRYTAPRKERPVDTSSPSIVRDPNKCVLCGDCVRFCSEIQGLGVLDFHHRGSDIVVGPAFHKGLAEVDCVACGQCAAVCPTGALTVKSDIHRAHAALDDARKTVVIQIAPAVRVALGEAFHLDSDAHVMGRLVAALRRLGFDKVYDTTFAADLTVLEEANEFLKRKEQGRDLPLFTSCCPAWVTMAEQDFPELLPHVKLHQTRFKSKVEHISSCRSPQQMFGSLAKQMLPEQFGIRREDLVVVSLMPCTAKKFEAARPEFAQNGNPDVDLVLTTQEVIRMIKDAGLDFPRLAPEGLDQPFGFKTGAGLIFGASGGVAEAVLRYLVQQVDATEEGRAILETVRAEEGRREFTANLPVGPVKVAVVHGLANARALVNDVLEGRADYDFVEIMACPGGCVGGAGQPVAQARRAVSRRTQELRHLEAAMDLHRPQENHAVSACYASHLGGKPGSHEAHELLHTRYQNRRRIAGETLPLSDLTGTPKIPISVCVGTGCHLRGANDLLSRLLKWAEQDAAAERFEIRATFCMEACDKGPSVTINGEVMHRATFDGVMLKLEELPEDVAVVTAAAGCGA